MKAGWKKTQLGDVIDIHDSRRIPLSGAQRRQRQGKFPYYGAQNIIDYIDDYIFDGTYLLIAEDGENLRSRKEPIASFARGKFWVNNHAHIVTAKPGLADDYFIKACLNHANLAAYVTGAAQPKLSQGNLKQIEIDLPDLPTQRKITSILSAYDDLIENNLRRIKILEEMAQSLYREWFVHFRFPGHQSVPLVDSSLGAIPEGWEVKVLGEIAEFKLGKMLDKEKNKGELMPYLANVNVRWGRFELDDLREMRFTPNELEAYGLRSGDIVMCEGGEPGRCAVWNEQIPGMMIQKAIHRIRCRENMNSSFLYQSLLRLGQGGHLASLFTGATIKHLPREQLAKVKIVAPPRALLDAFIKLVRPAEDQVAVLESKIQILRRTRDLLLPKLLSTPI